jgi:hypothetical protein
MRREVDIGVWRRVVRFYTAFIFVMKWRGGGMNGGLSESVGLSALACCIEILVHLVPCAILPADTQLRFGLSLGLRPVGGSEKKKKKKKKKRRRRRRRTSTLLSPCNATYSSSGIPTLFKHMGVVQWFIGQSRLDPSRGIQA